MLIDSLNNVVIKSKVGKTLKSNDLRVYIADNKTNKLKVNEIDKAKSKTIAGSGIIIITRIAINPKATKISVFLVRCSNFFKYCDSGKAGFDKSFICTGH